MSCGMEVDAGVEGHLDAGGMDALVYRQARGAPLCVGVEPFCVRFPVLPTMSESDTCVK